MRQRRNNKRLVVYCLLMTLAVVEIHPTETKAQRAKSKPNPECARCPDSDPIRRPCLDCPVPEGIESKSKDPIPTGFPCCGQGRERGTLADSATRRVEPKYPEEAKKRGIQGNVVVEVLVDGDG